MSDEDPRHHMLARMSECAFRLGEHFGAAAEAAQTHAEKVQAFELFDRCFFAVRVSIALELRLRRESRWRPAVEIEAAERETADPSDDEPLEVERYTECDRERDREAVSLPVLLRTVSGIVDAAAALPGPPPAELPTLRELLVRMSAAPADVRSAGGVIRPASAANLRARLAGSATAPAVAFAGSAGFGSARGGMPTRRRATGPPT